MGNFKLYSVLLAVLAFLCTPLKAQQVLAPIGTSTVACAFNTSPPAIATGFFGYVQCDSAGNLILSPTGGPSGPLQVQGNVASGVADSGNPVKIGCQYIAVASIPTFTSLQRTNCISTANGEIRVAIGNGTAGVVTTQFFNADAVGFGSNLGLTTTSMGTAFNGASWDRTRTIQGAVAAGTGTAATAIAATSTAAGALSHSSGASAALNTLSVKASAGNLYAYNCTAISGAAAGFCIAYNGSATPGTGALTAANVLDFCFMDNTARGCSLSRIPMYANYNTGIQILISSAATPYTYTTGVLTGAITADFQ